MRARDAGTRERAAAVVQASSRTPYAVSNRWGTRRANVARLDDAKMRVAGATSALCGAERMGAVYV